jgi:Aldehyde dehydrogenase family
MPIGLSSAFNGAAPAGLLQMYAEIVKAMDLEEVRASASGATIVRREPVGVVGAIAPWNYPQVLAMMKITPALAAGCTVVLKPSPETVLDSYVMGDAAQEAGLPPGVLNIVLADRGAGAALVDGRRRVVFRDDVALDAVRPLDVPGEGRPPQAALPASRHPEHVPEVLAHLVDLAQHRIVLAGKRRCRVPR